MLLYCPAFLLFLPDSIFNLQQECEKEERRAIVEQSEDSHHRQGSLQRSRYGSTDEASANVNAENNDSFPSATLAIPTQSQQANSQIGEDTSNKPMQSLLYVDEPKAYLVGPLFSYVFDVQGLVSTLMALAPLILILLSSPKDFLITVREDIRQVICLICKENTVSVGEDMLRHLRKLAVNSYKLASCLINVHQKH